MIFQNPPLFSDAVRKLLSHSIAGKAPHAVSAQVPGIFLYIGDSLWHRGNKEQLTMLYTQAPYLSETQHTKVLHPPFVAD